MFELRIAWMTKAEKSRKFWYWEWRLGYVFAFMTGTLLFIVGPALFLLNALSSAPRGQTPGLAIIIDLLLIILSPLAAHTLLYWGRIITVRGEKEYGPRIVAAVAGILFVLVVTGTLAPHGYSSIWLAASAFAGFIIIILNIVATILRLLLGREVVFTEEKKRSRKGRD